MLPSILAGQLKQGIKDYIRTTFPMTNEPFAGSLDAMFDGNDAVFHQPYVSVKLPFRKASAKPDCFSGVELPFMPYVHQEKAYARLTGDNSRSNRSFLIRRRHQSPCSTPQIETTMETELDPEIIRAMKAKEQMKHDK